MSRESKYPPDVREWAVRMLLEQEASYSSRWAATQSTAEKISCTPETLHKWVQ